eukprot:COSAG01_NODE_2879_length_6922_cov_7.777810_4_plen_55_part_00
MIMIELGWNDCIVASADWLCWLNNSWLWLPQNAAAGAIGGQLQIWTGSCSLFRG